MIKHSCLVVANGAEATFFRYTDEGSALEKVWGLGNSFAHIQDQDIVTDRPGVMSGGGSNIHGKDAMGVENSASDKAKEDFIKEVADKIESARKQNKLESVDIIAEPKTMGILRKNFSSSLSKLIDRSVSKDGSAKSTEDLLKMIGG